VLSIGWIVAGCWVAAAPELRAPLIGPAAVILFAEYFWLALAYVLFFFLGRWLSQGVSIALFITVLGLFLSGPFNMHSVRTIAAGQPAATAAQGRLSKHIDAWLEARRSEIESAGSPYPVFIVSAEGGGIRAAFWTAGLLGAIQDVEPAFADHVLGISGVSGEASARPRSPHSLVRPSVTRSTRPKTAVTWDRCRASPARCWVGIIYRPFWRPC
jgi:hypothetical protein